MQILLNEGFRYTNSVDIFDAGPIIEASCADIRTIRTSSTTTIVDVVDELDSPRFIASTTGIHFRATTGSVLMNDNGATVTRQLADLLKVNQGDMIRVARI
jgi:arginine N-succinyltransferase